MDADDDVAGGDGREEPPDEEETRTATGQSQPRTPGEARRLAAAEMIGRYRVLSLVGVGGMGQVYAAYDPKLDRRVAIKLLRKDAGSASAERLTREARALARISHPNVVTIHEVDEYDGRLAIAMEYVEGETLRDWARRVPANSGSARMRDALDYLLQAGRGLAAVHAGGFVHRDFKPSNVLVGRDGRVRVADFGVAQLSAEEPARAEAWTDEDVLERFREELTAAGKVVGTPAYMAPEQRAGEMVDAKSDQFSFCLTAWEVLVGERPELAGRRPSTQSQLETTRDGDEVILPSGLEGVLRRGLSKRPGARFANLDRLIERLETERKALDGTGRPGRWVRRSVVGITAGVLVSAVTIQGRDVYLGRRCKQEAAGLSSTWNDETGAKLDDAIRQQPLPYAAHTAEHVVPMLSDFAERWGENAEQACVGYRVEGSWSDEEYERLRLCLDERRFRFELLVDLLGAPGRESVMGANSATRALLALPECVDPARLPVGIASSTTADSSEYRELRLALDRARHEMATTSADPTDQLVALAARANDSGFEQLATDANLLLIAAYLEQGEDAPVQSLARSVYSRSAERQDWASAMSAATALSRLPTVGEDVSKEWLELAESAANRIDQPDDRLLRELTWSRARLLYRQGHLDEATQLLERVLSENLADPLESPARNAAVYGSLIGFNVQAGRLAEARRLGEEGLGELRSALGPGHPALVGVLNNLGALALKERRPDDALRHLEAALAIMEAHPRKYRGGISSALANIGYAHRLAGDNAAAAAAYERALALGPSSNASLNYAALLVGEGREQEAVDHLLDALSKLEQKGVHSRERTALLVSLARTEVGRGHLASGRAYFTQAIAIPAADPNQPSERWLEALVGAGCIAVGQGDAGNGFAQLSEAYDKAGHIRGKRAWVAKRWAEVLWDAPTESGGDKARARALMAEAQSGLAVAGPRFEKYLPEVEDWLASHTL